jgi:hypothetical protein
MEGFDPEKMWQQYLQQLKANVTQEVDRMRLVNSDLKEQIWQTLYLMRQASHICQSPLFQPSLETTIANIQKSTTNAELRSHILSCRKVILQLEAIQIKTIASTRAIARPIPPDWQATTDPIPEKGEKAQQAEQNVQASINTEDARLTSGAEKLHTQLLEDARLDQVLPMLNKLLIYLDKKKGNSQP